MPSPRTAAFFDVDSTLAASNVVRVCLSFQRHRLRGVRWWRWLLLFLARVPYYALLDLVDRRAFNIAFCRNYRGVTLQEVRAWVQGPAIGFWNRLAFPQGSARVQAHKAQGHLIVLVSGGLEPLLEPLAQRLGIDALYASRPEVVNGRLTGRLIGPPVVDRAKVAATLQGCAALGVDLGVSYAYADSYGDRFFLALVGHPAAVNPNRRLRSFARKRGWPVERWRMPSPMP